jgi:hypothetical protein
MVDGDMLLAAVTALGASLAAILFAGAAVRMVFSTVADATRMRASAAWPAVDGVVLTSRVETFWSDTGGRQYMPVVKYSYVVDGRPCEGRDVRIRGFITKIEIAEQVVRDRPPGARVRVFVDPSDPGRAVLQPALPGTFVNRPLIALGAGLASWMAEFFALVSISSRATNAAVAVWVLGGLIVAALVCLTGGARLIARHRRPDGTRGYAVICGLGLIVIGAVAVVAPALALVYRLRA